MVKSMTADDESGETISCGKISGYTVVIKID